MGLPLQAADADAPAMTVGAVDTYLVEMSWRQYWNAIRLGPGGLAIDLSFSKISGGGGQSADAAGYQGDA